MDVRLDAGAARPRGGLQAGRTLSTGGWGGQRPIGAQPGAALAEGGTAELCLPSSGSWEEAAVATQSLSMSRASNADAVGFEAHGLGQNTH